MQHPNEYIRGVTLRFLCRIREEEILEPLVPSILANLEHRHSYVRRNAVLAVNAIYKLPKGELLLQDAPETIEKVLRSEQDLSTKRNAFVMLAAHAQDKAARYLFENIEQVSNWGDILQMGVLELIRKVILRTAAICIAQLPGNYHLKLSHKLKLVLLQVCRTNPAEKGRYIKIILALLQSSSTAVVYECAVTLVSLSQAPSAIRAAANCFCQLLVSQSDNNIKLIVLDRLQELKDKHRDVMQDVLMDILRALSSPNMDIRKKTLDISMDLITSRNIDEVGAVVLDASGHSAYAWCIVWSQYWCKVVVRFRTCCTVHGSPVWLMLFGHMITYRYHSIIANDTAMSLQVVMVLKKEIMKTQNKDFEKGGEYRQMLVQAIHNCAVKFPDVAANVVHLLMDFLGDANTASALDVVFFVREIMETNAKLRQSILERLRDTFYQIRSVSIHIYCVCVFKSICKQLL